MSFLLLKTLHVFCATCSYILFVLRGIWKLNDSAIAQQRWVKVVPHLIDTTLIFSAAGMAYLIQQYPFVDGWLTAKLLAMLLYIWLGLIALKYGKSKKIRLFAWLSAQAVFFYIVLVAVNHNPVPLTHLELAR